MKIFAVGQKDSHKNHNLIIQFRQQNMINDQQCKKL